MPHRVELRVLSASPDPLGAEVHPLVLLHWDGRELRVAAKDALPASLEGRRAPLRRLIQTIAKRAQSVGDESHLDLGLDAVFPVREGDGGVTAWSPVRIGHTVDPQGHFDELVQALRLVRSQRASSVTAAEVRSALLLVANDLVARTASTALAGQVLADHHVLGFRDLNSPLSWRGEHWWHTCAIVPTVGNKDEGIGRVLGTYNLRVPRGDGLLVVVPTVGESAALDELDRAIEYVGARDGGRLQTVHVAVREDALDTGPVRSRVVADLGLADAA